MRKISLRLNRIPLSIKSSFAILVSSFFTQAISFLTTPIFTRLLSLEEYGLITQYNSWNSIITVFATLSLSAGVFQVAMNEFPDDRDRFTFSALVLSNICTIIIYGFIFGFSSFFSSFFQLPISMIILMFVYTLFVPAMNMWIARQRYELNYKSVLIVSVGTALLSQIISVITVSMKIGNHLGIVKSWSQGGVMIAVSLGLYMYIAKKAKYKPSIDYIKYAFVFNAPLLIHYLAQYALRSTDKIMITRFIGESATAVYGLGATVANIATLLWSAMAASLVPFIYDKLNKKDYISINKVVLIVETVFGLGCIFVSIIGPEVIYILGSSKYKSGIPLIPPVAASSLLYSVYSFYSTIALYHHKRTSTAVMTVIAAVINFVLNYFFIPKYGFVAAAYTTEAAYLIYTFLHFLNYRHIVGKGKIYNDILVFGIVAGTTLMCLAVGLLYDHVYIRYGLVLILMTISFVFRRQIFSTIKTVMRKQD